MHRDIWNIAHRGFSGAYPENTMIAFKKAIFNHADIIEIDLQLTKDNIIVAFHDRKVDRILADHKGKRIKDFHYKELQKLDAGSWFDSSFEGIKIPSLHDIMTELPSNISLILEIKDTNHILIEKMLNLLDDYSRTLGKGYISVRDMETYSIVKEQNQKYKIGVMQKKRTPVETIDLIKQHELSIIQIRWRKWSEDEWEELLRINPVITAYYADTIPDYKYLINKGGKGILTNFPNKLHQLLRKN